ncbi:MAG: Flp pilus assembly pilin Flp [Alphaproteobacteria bacterium]|jgi:Flp pilus assembly pilin Flp
MRILLPLHEVLLRIRRESRGAVSTEYAFLITFIAIAAAVGMVTLGDALSDYLNVFGNALGDAGNAANPS